MAGVDNSQRQIVGDVLTELVGCLQQIETGPADKIDDVPAHLYLLRNAAATAPELEGHAAVAEWINRAAALLRDESDRQQALQLLGLAAARLAAAAVEPPEP